MKWNLRSNGNGCAFVVGEVDEPDFRVKMVAITFWIQDRDDCWLVLHWRTFQRLSATRLLRHFTPSLAQESVVFPSSGNKHRRRIAFSFMLWCAASSEKDLVMGMIQRALSGVDLSSRHLQAARQVQASPGLNGPPVNLSWRKPKNCRYEKNKFFHAHCYKSAMIFTPFFLVHAGFPKRTNQVTLQSNRFHLSHSCKYRIEKKNGSLSFSLLVPAAVSSAVCKYELTLYISEKPLSPRPLWRCSRKPSTVHKSPFMMQHTLSHISPSPSESCFYPLGFHFYSPGDSESFLSRQIAI